MIRVLIAEDMHMIRGALVALLDIESDIEVVADLDRGDAVVAIALSTKPDVTILDIDMPGLDGPPRRSPTASDASPEANGSSIQTSSRLRSRLAPAHSPLAKSTSCELPRPADQPSKSRINSACRLLRFATISPTQSTRSADETASTPYASLATPAGSK